MPERIGFIGLGTMGGPMCANLVKAGYPMTVFARRPEQATPLVELGARQAKSPRDLAQESDVIITIVGDSPDVKSLMLSEDGILAGSRPGQVVIDMTSILPKVAQELAEKAAQVGVDMLDAPVSGGDVGAREARLTIMVGGRKDVLERCRPILSVLGNKIVWAGSSGMGQMLKLCNQIICGLNLLALGEGLGFAKACGLDLATVLDVVSSGAAGSWMLSNLGPRILQGDFEPGFSVAWQQKDLRNAQKQADAINFPLPGTAIVQQMFRLVEKLGLGKEGTQAIMRAYEIFLLQNQGNP